MGVDFLSYFLQLCKDCKRHQIQIFQVTRAAAKLVAYLPVSAFSSPAGGTDFSVMKRTHANCERKGKDGEAGLLILRGRQTKGRTGCGHRRQRRALKRHGSTAGPNPESR